MKELICGIIGGHKYDRYKTIKQGSIERVHETMGLKSHITYNVHFDYYKCKSCGKLDIRRSEYRKY